MPFSSEPPGPKSWPGSTIFEKPDDVGNILRRAASSRIQKNPRQKHGTSLPTAPTAGPRPTPARKPRLGPGPGRPKAQVQQGGQVPEWSGTVGAAPLTQTGVSEKNLRRFFASPLTIKGDPNTKVVFLAVSSCHPKRDPLRNTHLSSLARLAYLPRAKRNIFALGHTFCTSHAPKPAARAQRGGVCVCVFFFVFFPDGKEPRDLERSKAIPHKKGAKEGVIFLVFPERMLEGPELCSCFSFFSGEVGMTRTELVVGFREGGSISFGAEPSPPSPPHRGQLPPTPPTHQPPIAASIQGAAPRAAAS